VICMFVSIGTAEDEVLKKKRKEASGSKEFN
jgi:hypothetical protein